MRQVFRWLAVLVLCCATHALAGEAPPDARLQEAQKAYDAAKELDAAGKYAEALNQGKQALALREAVLGGSHQDVASCLDLLGTVHRHERNYAQAEPLIRRGLALREAALGDQHPAVAQSLNNLANLYLEKGQPGQAEPLYLRALAIREAALGGNHIEVAQSLNNLAVLYDRQGQYSRAEPLYLRSIAIREAILGKDHPLVANTLGNLAILYEERGWFDRAEQLLKRTLAIQEEVLGKDHFDVATSLTNLANLYTHQGLYDRSEPLYRRALAIREALLGKEHPLIAIALLNLAVISMEQGAYSQVEPLFERVLAIQEKALGKTHPEVAISLENLARFYAAQGQYDRAEPLYRRALAVWEAVGGKNHPQVAIALYGLGNLSMVQGAYGRAGALHQRALSIREAALGGDHPLVAESLTALALVRVAQRRVDPAVSLLARSFTVSERRLRQEALDFSEARLGGFLQYLRIDADRLYTLVREHPENARVRRLALGAALLLKGRSVEETAKISQAVFQSLGPEEHQTFERLRGLRTQLARRALEGPGSLPPAIYQQQLQELARQGDELEGGLARRSARLRALFALPSPAAIVDRVAKALPRDGALVELISYEDRPRVPGPSASQAPLRYLALVLLPDASTRALDLGLAEPIESAASRLHVALANRDADFQVHAQALYRLAFQPLLPLLGKAHRLYLSPDGQLALVPFAALHDGQQFLVDAFDFTYLTSGKDLLPRLQETASAVSVDVLADPDFSAPLPSPASSRTETLTPPERSAAVEHFFSALSGGSVQRTLSVVPLPGTRREAEAIQQLFPQARLFLGSEATKQRLLSLPTPGILHLATHGFFLEDAAAPTGSRALGTFGELGEGIPAPSLPDPLLRSGLLLAGASASVGSSAPALDRALVTALELAGLDLWGTQLVVLSACDTGRGDTKVGQGVYGLRRAFMVAGAETVVTSLWKVNDETTRVLMEAYYRNLLAGQGRAAALREAMRALRETQPHPHYWAPFLVLGRDAPLQGLTSDVQERPKP